MTTDSAAANPRDLIDNSPMRGRQFLIIGICILLNAIDGFDVMSISFAAPGIARDWGIGAAAIGVVLSMELIGMAFGSIFLGNMADLAGRRPTAILCLLLMASGMFASAIAENVTQLSAFRFLTGLGIGGMLAAANALVAEFSNNRWRGTAVALMGAGFPLGGIIGGTISAEVLASATGTWRDVFMLGAIGTTLALPLVYFLVPESVGYLIQKRDNHSLAKVNRTLRFIGMSSVTAIAPKEPGQQAVARGWSALFSKAVLPITILLTCGYFLHVVSSYFFVKWVPTIVSTFGFDDSAAASVLVWANVGGLLGALVFSFLSVRFELKTLVLGSLAACGMFLAIFGQVPRDLASLSMAAAATVFFGSAGVVGFYALMATSFPTHARASGIGFVIGLGRGGSALGPMIGGAMFAAGLSLETTMVAMAAGSLLGTIMLALLVSRRDPTA